MDDGETTSQAKEFERSLSGLINEHGIDNRCSIPDFILAKYLMRMIEVLDQAAADTDQWFSTDHRRNWGSVKVLDLDARLAEKPNG